MYINQRGRDSGLCRLRGDLNKTNHKTALLASLTLYEKSIHRCRRVKHNEFNCRFDDTVVIIPTSNAFKYCQI